jgi:hypothetical protein
MFEIRAAHRSRKISFFLSGSEVGVGVPAAGWMVGKSGRRRPRRWPPAVIEAGGGGRSVQPEVRVSGFGVVEAAEPGCDDDGSGGGVRVMVQGSGSPADLEMRGGRGSRRTGGGGGSAGDGGAAAR